MDEARRRQRHAAGGGRERDHPAFVVVDFAAAFWLCAADVARYTADPLKSFDALMRSYRSMRPDASQDELAATEAQLRGALGLVG